jgi:hypothetical protein
VEQYNLFWNSNTEIFTVGSETCECSIQFTGYCNGQLKPGTAYKFKIRAFTAKDKYNDTLYSAPVITSKWNILKCWFSKLIYRNLFFYKILTIRLQSLVWLSQSSYFFVVLLLRYRDEKKGTAQRKCCLWRFVQGSTWELWWPGWSFNVRQSRNNVRPFLWFMCFALVLLYKTCFTL